SCLGHAGSRRSSEVVTTELESKGPRKRGARLLRAVLYGLTEVRENLRIRFRLAVRRLSPNNLHDVERERHAMWPSVLRQLARDRPPRRGLEIQISPAHGNDFATALGCEQPYFLDSRQRRSDRAERLSVGVGECPFPTRCLLLVPCRKTLEQRP